MDVFQTLWNIIKTIYNFFLQNWKVCMTIICFILMIPIIILLINLIKSIKEVSYMTSQQAAEENEIYRKEIFEKMECSNDSKIEEAALADSSLFFESE